MIPVEIHVKASLNFHESYERAFQQKIRIQTNRKRRQLMFDINGDKEKLQNTTDTCCSFVCKCKDNNCLMPKCEEFHFLLLANNFVPTVGQCCQPFECRPKQCLTDDHKILNQGESKLSEHDPCIECRCHDGITRCSTHHCVPLSCIHQIQQEEECCPKCDVSKSTFCPNDENCDRACRHGFIKHADGCDICLCQPGNITKALSTTTVVDEWNDWETSTHFIIITPEVSNITPIDEHPQPILHKGMFVIIVFLVISTIAVVVWAIKIGRNRWIPIRLF